ncbi:bifunctional diaminohydroxyphosphoribosylaminopyrimidine deaminase/5-amino-6-(5-phosphoribosylamino)uracil reductase RibD [Flavobacterium sp. SUN052]|uniref:bifunctional diaminohydroxyphosphoribosylaminopyrimidine deaminase/5-amino-6-(5-phosphoribosylamino)uracil reductase RibD n=1 Tax=Flavobacterium sp. SUN052 TaxID=3002441 RepID=UPI00237ED50E|nr:bifunctional diaminohydroxyphosphoribosylaminopyrimidine deaminase/5-amino-6-(5-phosphoribosylamino)uracil reductase RibD [Flavobacterium sp. SUN052]MEC4005457.1 bifunctional diaminohydroxyphosphoribosylaminopyrimidine deaminase/5-amino-6-(5-phosphoribosylamino)uracil reductase RibD [Flavobacterium sp. SUN052]
MKTHETYIKRCIELAKNGLGTTYPNPLVGSVIVYNNEIIGEGWHRKAGEPHAEVNAINSVKDKSLLNKSTIYVSLEPCSHFGKTPPCCDLIIANAIPNVVIGTIDPFAKVAGNGIKKLIEAGKNVTIGILEEECNELNKRFFTFHTKKRPYIILKWAESQGGFIAPSSKENQKPVWITNEYSRQLVHKWRSEEQAILVGTNTVIDDNPSLTTRDWTGNNPIRIVLDQNNRISKENLIFDNQAKTISISNDNFNFTNNLGQKITDLLFYEEIQSIIIEGGRQTLQTFIDENLWDEARVFKGRINFKNGTKAPKINFKNIKRQQILEDELLIFFNHD